MLLSETKDESVVISARDKSVHYHCRSGDSAGWSGARVRESIAGHNTIIRVWPHVRLWPLIGAFAPGLQYYLHVWLTKDVLHLSFCSRYFWLALVLSYLRPD